MATEYSLVLQIFSRLPVVSSEVLLSDPLRPLALDLSKLSRRLCDVVSLDASGPMTFLQKYDRDGAAAMIKAQVISDSLEKVITSALVVRPTYTTIHNGVLHHVLSLLMVRSAVTVRTRYNTDKQSQAEPLIKINQLSISKGLYLQQACQNECRDSYLFLR